MSKRPAVWGVVVALLLGACVPVDEKPEALDELPPIFAPSDGSLAEVVRVPDGDSLVVLLNGAEEKVRLIGINAPEHDECLGPESGEALRDLLDGAKVLLVADEESTDQYGRLLRYVWIGDVLANRHQAAAGLAIARGFPPNTTSQHLLDEAESFARDRSIGIWDPAACGGEPAPSIEILFVEANPSGRDEDNLNGEYIVLRNPNDLDVDLSGWILRDSSTSHRYEFPAGTMLEYELTIYTGCGDDTTRELFWCADGPVWDNGGDEAFLLTPSGGIAATLEYSEQR